MHSLNLDSTQLNSERPPDVVVHDGKEYNSVREGLATILNPHKSNGISNEPLPGASSQAVFYNPVQQFNRDLSVLAIRVFAEDQSVLRKTRHEKWLRESSKKGRTSQKRKRGSPVSIDGAQTTEPYVKQSGSHFLQTLGAENKERGKRLADGQETEKHIEGNAELRREAAPVKSSEENGSIECDVHISGQPHFAHAVGDSTKGENEAKSSREGFRILDALSATGLRALRYAKEIERVTSVTANDLSASATSAIKINVRHNQLVGKVHALTGNALTHMYHVGSGNQSALPDGHRGKYDVIDLDPFGTAAPFLDAACQALYDGGLLCVTCTDSGVFASVGYLEKTFSQYGGLPFKGPQSHEAGLRLILHAIASSAARYGIAIEPLISLSIDYYARVFVRVHKSPAEVKLLAGKTMLIYNCDHGCGAWTAQFLAQTKASQNKNGSLLYKFTAGQAPSTSMSCEHCGFKTHLSGPMWGGPLHNPHFIRRILNELPSLNPETYATIPRIEGMLSTALEECSLDPNLDQSSTTENMAADTPAVIARLDPSKQDKYPFFLVPSALAKVLHCVAPSDAALRGALLKLNYRVARSHTKAGSIHTDAPWTVVWEIMREWVRQKAPIKADAIKEGTAGWGIMRHHRRGYNIQNLKTQLNDIVLRVDDLSTARTELEALLHMVGKESGKIGNLGIHADGKDDVHHGELEVDFDEDLGKDVDGKKLVRYQLNPRAYWGPMARPKAVESE